MPNDVKDDRARVVIVGGGVAGTSIAYHLTKLGWNDVLLLDRSELTSGSTFHSAGLVAQLRNSVSHTRMMMDGVELYAELEAETGIDVGWHQVGTLHLASSPYRLEALARQAGWAKSFGLPVEIVSASEALERFPLLDVSNVLGAQFVPTDGHLDPTGLTMAFAEGAKRRGARIRTGMRVVEIPVRDGRVTGVVTDQGPIEAEVVVNTAAEKGRALVAGEELGTIESVKAVSEIYAPLSGEVLEVNAQVVDRPETVNEDPYGEGWLIRIRMSSPDEVDSLLSAEGYGEVLAAQ